MKNYFSLLLLSLLSPMLFCQNVAGFSIPRTESTTVEKEKTVVLKSDFVKSAMIAAMDSRRGSEWHSEVIENSFHLDQEITHFKDWVTKYKDNNISTDLKTYFDDPNKIKKIVLTIRAPNVPGFKPSQSLAGLGNGIGTLEIGHNFFFYFPLAAKIEYKVIASGELERVIKDRRIPLKLMSRTGLNYDSLKFLILDYMQNSFGAPVTFRYTWSRMLSKHTDYLNSVAGYTQPISEFQVAFDLRALPYSDDKTLKIGSPDKVRVGLSVLPSYLWFYGGDNGTTNVYLQATGNLGYFNTSGINLNGETLNKGLLLSIEGSFGVYNQANPLANFSINARYNPLLKVFSYTVNFNPKFESKK